MSSRRTRPSITVWWSSSLLAPLIAASAAAGPPSLPEALPEHQGLARAAIPRVGIDPAWVPSGGPATVRLDARSADRIALLDAGRLVADAAPGLVMADAVAGWVFGVRIGPGTTVLPA
jgi:hypothetical protein